MQLRPLNAFDQGLLWQFLIIAAHETELAAVRDYPKLARYAEGWGRHGDSGWLAQKDGAAVGVTWLRLWPGQDKGFGWVRDDVPELAIAVMKQYQGQGIGSALLKQILESARGVYPAVSLNVRRDNPAVRLYVRFGFTSVPGSERPNRSGGISFNMLCQLK